MTFEGSTTPADDSVFPPGGPGEAEKQLLRRKAEVEVRDCIAAAVSGTPDLGEAMRQSLRRVRDVIEFTLGQVFLLSDEDSPELIWAVGEGPEDEFAALSRRLRFPPGVGMVGRVLTSAQPLYIPDIRLDNIFWADSVAVRCGYRSAIAVPITSQDRPVGAMEFFFRECRVLSKEELEFLSAFGQQIGLPISHARLSETLKQAHKDLRRLEAQLFQQEKLASLGLLAAGVAHEINNPVGFLGSNLEHLERYLTALTAYLTRAEALAQAAGAGEELAALRRELDVNYILSDIPGLLTDARAGVARVARIVRDLKMFSHSDGGEAAEGDLHQILESTLTILTTELKCRAEVVRDYGDLPLIRCHLSQIQQVFLNLIMNAIQAMEERGTITLRTGSTSQEVWVEVSDTGCGIPVKNLPRIFDPFFTTKPVGQGTGLGLAISYGIVERHGGRIEVASQEGRGATFRVLLPLNGRVHMDHSRM